ncbi:DnaD domain protein, partial [Listeria monocytogenes]|nr:DnaD domain protein [Listeria monocytogenes]
EKQRQIDLEQKYNKPAFNKYNKQTKQEILPDWFDKEQQEAPKQPEMTEEEKEAMERQVAEIKAKLAARNEVQA